METRFNSHNNFEVKTTDGKFVQVFDKLIYLSKPLYPIGGKYYRLVGLGGQVQDAFFKTFGKDMLLLSNLTEVDEALQQIIITLNYKVGNYVIEK